MERFMYKIHEFMGVDNYEVLCENPNHEESTIYFSNNILFGLSYLKLIDCALKHSKEDILKTHKKKSELYNVARYPSGETLGFYNTSEYDLEKLSECLNEAECRDKLINYIEGFSDNIKVVFEEIDFKKVIDFLFKVNMTMPMIGKIHKTPLESHRFYSYINFMDIFGEFIRLLWKDEIYNLSFHPIANNDPLSSFHYIPKPVDEYGTFLNKLLLTDINFKDKHSIRIYDPNSNGAYILHKAKDTIGNDNVELYGKSVKNEMKLIRLAKNSISKRDSYEIDDATILKIEENIFSIPEIDSYSDFDLIISNYLYTGFKEHKKILEEFNEKAYGNTKLTIALNSIDDFIKELEGIIKNDNLETVISFKNHYMLIANLNKSENKKGRFLLINQSDANLNDEIIERENKQAFANDHYDAWHGNNWKQLSERDYECMEEILKSYESFQDTINSKLIYNRDYDEEMLKIMLN